MLWDKSLAGGRAVKDGAALVNPFISNCLADPGNNANSGTVINQEGTATYGPVVLWINGKAGIRS